MIPNPNPVGVGESIDKAFLPVLLAQASSQMSMPRMSFQKDSCLLEVKLVHRYTLYSDLSSRERISYAWLKAWWLKERLPFLPNPLRFGWAAPLHCRQKDFKGRVCPAFPFPFGTRRRLSIPLNEGISLTRATAGKEKALFSFLVPKKSIPEAEGRLGVAWIRDLVPGYSLPLTLKSFVFLSFLLLYLSGIQDFLSLLKKRSFFSYEIDSF